MAVEKKNVYQIVTERFMAQLREGVVPWSKPWFSVNGIRTGAWSHSRGITYSLLNQMMLPGPGEYCSYKDVQKEGGQLKKGAKGYPVVFWKMYRTEVKDSETNRTEIKNVPVLRYYTVYRVADCEGVSYNYAPDTSALDSLKEPGKCKIAEDVANAYIKMSGVKYTNVPGDKAYYQPLFDEVVLPLRKQFNTKVEYYSTLYHELVHSTGSRERLNRLFTHTGSRGKDYSLEELVAEIGAAACMYEFRLETKDSIKNSNAYLQGWLRALENDSRMIVKAASRAEKAVRYIFKGPDGIRPNNDWKKVDFSEPVSHVEIPEIDSFEEAPF